MFILFREKPREDEKAIGKHPTLHLERSEIPYRVFEVGNKIPASANFPNFAPLTKSGAERTPKLYLEHGLQLQQH